MHSLGDFYGGQSFGMTRERFHSKRFLFSFKGTPLKSSLADIRIKLPRRVGGTDAPSLVRPNQSEEEYGVWHSVR